MNKLIVVMTALLGLLGWSAERLQAQESPLLAKGETLLTVKPQSFFLGANAGIDKVVARKLSVGAELTAQFGYFGLPPAVALTPSMKWFFAGQVGRGVYLRPKALVAHISKDTIEPLVVGGGLNLGFMVNFFGNSDVFLFGEAGLKLVRGFGEPKRPSKDKNEYIDDVLYLNLLSPASFPELSLGVAFKF